MAKLLAAQRAVNRERILLELHQHGPFQRIALSERLGLRANSVGSICGELLEWGMIREVPGSPANQLRISGKGPFYLAAYIGVDEIRVARVDLDGRVTACRQHQHLRNQPIATLDALVQWLKGACPGDEANLCGIGISTPAMVDSENGIVSYAANLPGWQNIEAAKRLSRDFQCPILVENEVRCHLWEEVWFKRRREVRETIIYLMIIQGLGCAVLAGGELLMGRNFASGEIGHVSLGSEGRQCSCGKRGCIEAYCSETALLREMRSLGLIPAEAKGEAMASGARLAEAFARLPHDARLAMVIDDAVERLACGIAPLLGALDPAELLVGSRDQAVSKALGRSLQHKLRQKLMGLPAFDIPVTAVQASEETAMRGAAGLMMRNYFKIIGDLSPAPRGRLPVALHNA